MELQVILLGVLIIMLLVNILLQTISKPRDSSAALLHQLKLDIFNQLYKLEQETTLAFKDNRAEYAKFGKDNQDLLSERLNGLSHFQANNLQLLQKQIHESMEGNTRSIYKFSESINANLRDIKLEWSDKITKLQKDNHLQLEKMRLVVDEKLQDTLDKRLGKSFELVSKHLEAVQKGLGEMQVLANGVGDLKKVLSNVKTRGVLGELQLANIIEELLTTDQYSVNVSTIPGSDQFVEFALKLPGLKEDDSVVWLPIDSKFPLDRYEKLIDAYENGEVKQIEKAKKDLVKTIKLMAKDIREKYIAPPFTTDFAILFLPIEGLYAEVVRQVGLMDLLQREYKIMLAGPSNLAAFLNSIQMGFRSIAIEKRSSEVWEVLSAVKNEFGKFSQVIDKVQVKLDQASKTIGDVGVRSRAIERNLRTVESLPESMPKPELKRQLGLIE